MSGIPRRSLPVMGSALASVPALLVLGLIYGAVEYAWQRWVSATPAGLPGDAGPGLWSCLALGATAFGVPALVAAALLLRLRGGLAPLLVWIAALAPTLVLVVDRLSTLGRWTWMGSDTGGTIHYAWLAAITLVSATVLSVAAMTLMRRFAPPLLSPSRPAVVAGLLMAALAPLALAIALPTPGIELDGGLPEDVERPNVLLVTVDTLRQDALGAYGGPPTPRMDAWIEAGVRFDGWAVSPWTRPSMGSLFSAVGPTGNAGAPQRALAPSTAWWVEDLRAHGWVTAAVVCNPQLRRRFGFDRGFEWFEHADEIEVLEPVARTLWGVWLTRQLVERGQTFRGDHMVGRALRWLRKDATRLPRPWMLWVHTMDPHLPYHLRGHAGELRHDAPEPWVDALGDDFDPRLQRFFDLPGAREGTAVESGPAREALRRLYQSEVEFTDHWIGELLDGARAASGSRPLLWVLTSDHGEEFWDDGGFEHGHSLHASVLRVPLAMGGIDALPAGADGGPMTLSDLGPTLLGLLDLPPLEATGGVELEGAEPALLQHVVGSDRSGSWLQAFDRDAAASCRTPRLLAEGMLYGPPQTRILHEDGTGLIRADERGTIVRRRVCGTADVAIAPPLADSLRTEERALLLSVDLWRERAAALGIEVEHDPELDRQLRALGYTQ